MKRDARLNDRQKRILEDLFGRSVAGETMQQVAESHGINRKTLSLWKNSDHGKQLHADFQKEMSTNDLPKFYSKLSEKMQSGSYKHMELYAKIHGLLAPEKQEVVTEERKVSDSPISKERLDEIKKRLGETVADADRTIKRVK
ncbi:phBC6A51 family helix-turn-helix protein [Rossellomorea sp. NRS-1567]|uniref:phBC6A51 family helix-turn-helix protein n=1 Tax=Rossellomorea sp. NRS-1567 TaxID=3233901 RepID=UPI003D2E1983